MRLKNRIKVQDDLDKLKKCSEKNGTQFNKDKYKVIYFMKDYELNKCIMRNNLPGSSLGDEDLAITVSHKSKPPYYC